MTNYHKTPTQEVQSRVFVRSVATIMN